MKKLSHIFDVYSRRGKPTQPFGYKLPSTFRNRVLLLIRDTFSNKEHPGRGNYIDTFWNEIHQMLTYQHGRPQLSLLAPFISSTMDTANFLLSCKDEEFLDFIEYIFKVECLFHVTNNENDLVALVNQLLALDGLGYEVTNFVTEEQISKNLGGAKVVITVAWPQVIRKDNQVIHEMAVKPALQLLSNHTFKSANLEYLEALDDYRRGDWGGSLTNCGSAFESVMKIICEKNNWEYSQSDTAGPLIKAIILNAKLEQHFEQPLVFIATLRNKYSKSHGAGVQPKKATQSIALLGLNLTASAILFLSEETK